MKGLKPETLDERIQRLKPLVELLEHPGMQQWMGEIEKDLKLMDKWSWRVGAVPQDAVSTRELAQVMHAMGAVMPTNEQEMFHVWHGFRSVHNYIVSRFEILRQAKENYESARQALIDAQAKAREKEEMLSHG